MFGLWICFVHHENRKLQIWWKIFCSEDENFPFWCCWNILVGCVWTFLPWKDQLHSFSWGTLSIPRLTAILYTAIKTQTDGNRYELSKVIGELGNRQSIQLIWQIIWRQAFDLQCQLGTIDAPTTDDSCPPKTAWSVVARMISIFPDCTERTGSRCRPQPQKQINLIFLYLFFLRHVMIHSTIFLGMWSPGSDSTYLYEYSCRVRDRILQQRPRKWWVIFSIRNDISRHTSCETMVLCVS